MRKIRPGGTGALPAGLHRPPVLGGPPGHPLWVHGKGWLGWALGAQLMAVCDTFTQLGNLSK